MRTLEEQVLILRDLVHNPDYVREYPMVTDMYFNRLYELFGTNYEKHIALRDNYSERS